MIRRFNRYELKYVIPAKTKLALLDVMRGQMSPDTEGSTEGAYAISSLYYDSIDLSCYRAKLDGVNYRRKLRLRRYGGLAAPGWDGEVMVEIKQRINRTTQKRRLALPLSEAYVLCDGLSERTFEDQRDREVASEVSYLAGALQLGPKCVISYRRTALVGSIYEPGLRITFDEHLTVSNAANGLTEGSEQRYFLPPDQVILEVKTNDVVPLWVSRLLAAEDCRVARFSKYCSGLELLLELPWSRRGTSGAHDG